MFRGLTLLFWKIIDLDRRLVLEKERVCDVDGSHREGNKGNSRWSLFRGRN